jgi:hypothetical protein
VGTTVGELTQDHFPFLSWRFAMKTAPWHSIRQSDRNVYHNNTSCTEGNNIESKYRKPGSDGRPLCQHCARLS